MADERTPSPGPWQNVILVATGDAQRDVELIRAYLAAGGPPRGRVYQAKMALDRKTYTQLFGRW